MYISTFPEDASIVDFYPFYTENNLEKRPIWDWSVAKELYNFWPKSYKILNAKQPSAYKNVYAFGPSWDRTMPALHFVGFVKTLNFFSRAF